MTPISRNRRSGRQADFRRALASLPLTVVLLVCSTYLVVFVLVLVLGTFWARDDAVPSVRILGSGSRLSLLVTNGRSRLLIAGGDDASAFASALSDARHPASRRIDVVLLAGGQEALPVALRAARDVQAGTILAIDGPLVAHLAEMGLSPANVVAKPIRIRLGATTVTVRPSPARDGGWSAEVQRGNTTVRAASGLSELDDQSHAAAVILTHRYDSDALSRIPEGAVIVPSRSASWATLRTDAAAIGNGRMWAIRVRPGEATRLTFTGRGLLLPPGTRALTDGQSPERASGIAIGRRIGIDDMSAMAVARVDRRRSGRPSDAPLSRGSWLWLARDVGGGSTDPPLALDPGLEYGDPAPEMSPRTPQVTIGRQGPESCSAELTPASPAVHLACIA